LSCSTFSYFFSSVQPPTLPSFPYTTLFRSTGIENINGTNYRYLDLLSTDTSSWTLNGRFNERFGGTGYIFPWEQECDGVVEWDIDRKSTRLNSSHVKISYAVFCLKKKNKKY